MGPHGPSVEERNRVELEYLKKKYGDLPYDELRRLAIESSARKAAKYKKKKERRKTA